MNDDDVFVHHRKQQRVYNTPHAHPTRATPTSGWWRGLADGLALFGASQDKGTSESSTGGRARDGVSVGSAAGSLPSPAQVAETIVGRRDMEALKEWRSGVRGVRDFALHVWNTMVLGSNEKMPNSAATARHASGGSSRDWPLHEAMVDGGGTARRRLDVKNKGGGESESGVHGMADAWASIDEEPQLPDTYRAAFNVPVTPHVEGSDDATVHDHVQRELSTQCGLGVPVESYTTVYSCDGQQVSLAQYNAILAAQALANATNANANANITIVVNNTTLPLIPPTIPVSNASCTTSQEVESICACPLDYVGSACETRRSVHCVAELESEEYKVCLNNNGAVWRGSEDYLLEYSHRRDGVPPCLTLTASTVLPFKMECAFATQEQPKCNGTNITQAQMDADGAQPPFYGLEGCMEGRLQYWLPPTTGDHGNTFAISTQPTSPMALRVRPWNMNRLSDVNGSVTTPITHDHLLGRSNVNVPLPSTAIPASTWAGGRVTLGVTAAPSEDGGSGGQVHIVSEMITADERNWKPPPPVDDTDVVLIVVLCLIVVVVVVVGVGVWWKFGRAKKVQQKDVHGRHEYVHGQPPHTLNKAKQM